MISFIKRPHVLLGSAFVLGVVLAGIFLHASLARAEVFQFPQTDPYYLTALSIASAQVAEDETNIENKIALDEDFTPEDYGFETVGLLPTSPLYFFKGLRRGVQNALTFDSVGKAEIRLRFAAEKLLEAEELAESGDVTEEEILAAVENFKNELADVRRRVEIAATSANEEEILELARGFIDAMTKYNKALGKLEKILPPSAFLELQETKERTSETFSSVFLLGDGTEISREIVEVLEAQKGSEFKHFKNIEVLKEIERYAPEGVKTTLQNVEDNIAGKLHVDFEDYDEAEYALFEEFLEEIGGNEVRHLEIINELQVRPLSEEVRDTLTSAKEGVFLKLEERLEELPEGENQERYIEHLEDGRFESFRIIEELENNIGGAVVSGLISGTRDRASLDLVRRIEAIDENEAEREKFENSIERFHDVRLFSIFDELESIIPEDKKDFFNELKEKAVEEVEEDLEQARDSAQRRNIFDALAGDHPGDFETLKNLTDEALLGRAVLDGLREANYRHVETRVQYIDDEERLKDYEESFNEEERFITGRFDAGNFEVIIREKRDIFESSARVDAKINEAEARFAEFIEIVDSLALDVSFYSGEFDPIISKIQRLRALAQRKLDLVYTVISYDDIGRAFSLAEEVENISRDGIELARDYRSGKKDVIRESEVGRSIIPEGGTYVLYNEYEFSRFCVAMQGYLEASLRCSLFDGRVLDAGVSGFPFKVNPNTLSCGGFAGVACPLGSYCEVSVGATDGIGQCVLGEDGGICSVSYDGYIYDQAKNECLLDRTQACEDPYIYHTRDICERAYGLNIDQCDSPEGCTGSEQCKVSGFYWCVPNSQCVNSRAECGDSVGVSDCGNAICEIGEVDSCPSDCGVGTSGSCSSARECQSFTQCESSGFHWCSFDNQCYSSFSGCKAEEWVSHTWTFKDGQTVESQILNRTDSEYLVYIDSIERECAGINKSAFRWKSNAQSDDPANWENFGIPDCSGAIVERNYCGDGVCYGDENSDWCPDDCGDVTSAECTDSDFAIEVKKRGTVIDKEGRYTDYCTDEYHVVEYVCNFNAVQKASSDPKGYDCRIFNESFVCEEGRCTVPSGVDPEFGRCGDGICASSETRETCYADCGSIDTTGGYCNDRICNNGETITSCPGDCGGDGGNLCSTHPYFCVSESECSDANYHWCSTNWECHREATSCPTVTSASCYTLTTESSCINSGSGCVWYSNHTDGPSGGAHCDDTAHGGSTTVYTECNDGIDNDIDGLIDYPADSGCYSSYDTSEIPDSGTGSGSCWSYGTDKIGCGNAGCIWYEYHTDGPTGGAHCDDSGHGAGDTSTATTMERCFYPNATQNGESLGWTVWCEKDYYNCHLGDPSGDTVSLTGLSLGAPSSCESWTVETPTNPTDYTSESSCTSVGYYWCSSDSQCQTWGSACGTTTPTQTDTCPSFAYSKWDSYNAHYCQLNDSVSCEYFYPESLTESNYSPSECPDTTSTTATSCSSTPSLCTTTTDCELYNFYWCTDNGACVSNSSLCSSSTTATTESSDMERCFYPNATQNGESLGWTVWCEKDYYNCHLGDPSGDTVSLTGLSLGAPSSCESWTSGTSIIGSSSHTSESSCTGAGYFWCDSQCHEVSASCTSTTSCSPAYSCTTSNDCSTSGYYWCESDSQCYSSSLDCSASSSSSSSNTTSSSYTYTDEASCSSAGYYWCSQYSSCYDSSSGCDTSSSSSSSGSTSSYASCWSYGTDQSGCASAGCTWYSDHTDGSTGGAHCDDSGHGASSSSSSSSGGGCGAWTSESDCLTESGCAWDSSSSYCYYQ